MRLRVPCVLGVLVWAAAWCGPLPRLATQAFAAHMTMHLAVVAVGAPLIAWGVAGTAWDPVRRWPRWFAPIPWSIAELIVVWSWHAPAAHAFARGSTAGLVAEQASFALVGFILWIGALGGAPAERRERAGSGVAALLLTSMHMTLLGALLALTPRPLYLETCGLGSLDDQQWGGAIMLLVGGVVYLAGGLALMVPLVRAPQPRWEGRP